MQTNGTLGLIATNTLAQGDTREVGLDTMTTHHDFTITRAIQSRTWPATSANLEYAAVWGTLYPIPDHLPRIADNLPARRISTLLEPAGRIEGNPVRLVENAGVAFQGCIVLGMGFVLDVAEAQEWIATDARNAEVLFPYLNGEDLNSRPDATASRWVIDFDGRTLGEAAAYALPFARVSEQVRPERMKNKRSTRRDYWWHFAERAVGMRSAISTLPEVLVIARVSKTVMPLRVPVGQIPSEACVVFATDDYGVQAVLSSSLHQLWAITYGSGMRSDPRYTPSDVFETFPQPLQSERLDAVGRALHQQRSEIMVRRDLGLTKLYNLVNNSEIRADDDPDVALVRDLHVQLDNEVVAAYGWSDLALGHGFHTYRKMVRWTVSPVARAELLDRLLEENHHRAQLDAPPGANSESPSALAQDTLFG